MIGNFKIKENSTHPMSLIVWEMMHLEMIKQDKQILIMKNKIFVLVKEMMYILAGIPGTIIYTFPT